VEYFGIHYAGCYDVFISIRGDGLGDERVGTTHIRVVETHCMSRKSRVCL